MLSSGKIRAPAILYLLILALGSSTHARTIHVDDNGPADFSTIQAAIDAAADGDTVLVQPGTYTGPGNRDIDFKGKAITVRGSDPNEASVVARTVIDCQGTERSPHRGVLFISGEGPNSVLEGLRITNGYAARIRLGNSDRSEGGAILCFRSGPTIRHCQIAGNSATYDGGGIFCMEAETTVAACTIIGNTTQFSGGGISCASGSVIIDGCAIRGNTSGFHGGAVSLKAMRATIDNCLLATNMSQVRGGAVFCAEDVTLTMTNCTVVDNIAGGYVGEGAGGVDPYYPHLRNGVTLASCIVWNNRTAGKCNRSTQISAYPVKVLYSCVFGWTSNAGEDGNTGADPLLTPDYRLRTDSPCIDAGDPVVSDGSSARDVDGDPRVSSGRIDMGCDEFVDSDTDGLPDSWEVVCFGSVAASSAPDDPDADSQENEKEYNEGGNPRFPSGVCYVDPNYGEDSRDGLATVWDGHHGPKATIQAAIDWVGSRDGDEIWLLPGIYRGAGNRDIDLQGKAITVRSTDPNDPDVVARTVIDCGGRSEEPHRAFFFVSGETNRSRVEGISIINGWADGNGGAIKCDIGSSPTVAKCILSESNATQRGGAISCGSYCNPAIQGCSIRNNTAQVGGAIYSGDWSGPLITGCRIEANSARERGGGIYTGEMHQQAGPVITGCWITGNQALDGGAILCDRSDAAMINCVLSRNSAKDSGGAITCSQAAPSFTNCTIVDNYAARFGGAFVGDGTGGWPVRFENCIIWGNSATDGDVIARMGCSMITGCPFIKIVFCCLPDDASAFYQGASYGWEVDFKESCFSADPHFVDWQAGDYRVMRGSPCIDVGTNTPTHATPDTDVDGKPRIVDGNLDGNAVIDLGACEFQGQ